jgi:hypothetical protein
MESIKMALTKQLSKEWLEGSRKRLEIAHQPRFSNPRVSMEILIQVVSELLETVDPG